MTLEVGYPCLRLVLGSLQRPNETCCRGRVPFCINQRGRLLTCMPREAEEAKKAEAARKKAEKDALMKEEEEAIGGRNEPKKSKAPVKKSRGLDLSQLDDDGPSTLNASGIDNALDALSLTAGGGDAKIDTHPERRFAAAYRAYEERRLNEMKADGSGTGLRLEQKKQRIRKEFDKSPENPFNQVTAAYNATRDDIREVRESEKTKIEKRLGA